MEKEIAIEQAELRPMELLKEGKALCGEQYWLFVGLCFVALFVGQAVPMGILLGPMLCGLYLCYGERRSGSTTEFNTLFRGFELFKESLIATLIVIAIIFVISLPLVIVFVAALMGIMIGLMEEAPVLAFSLLFLVYAVFFFVVMLIHIPFVFVYPLIANHGLTAMPAIKASVSGVRANLMGVIAMSVVFSLLVTVVGTCCFVLVYLLIPLTFAGIYLAYTRIFPLEKSIPQATTPV